VLFNEIIFEIFYFFLSAKQLFLYPKHLHIPVLNSYIKITTCFNLWRSDCRFYVQFCVTYYLH